MLFRSCMRRDELRLRDILESADFILSVMTPLTEEEFLQNPILQSAVLQKLIVIGEAAGRLTVELRERWPAVPWSDMRRLRDIAVHAYHTVDWAIISSTSATDIPRVRNQIAAILAAEFPPPDAA